MHIFGKLKLRTCLQAGSFQVQMAWILIAFACAKFATVFAGDPEPCGIPVDQPNGYTICDRSVGVTCWPWEWCSPVYVQIGPDPAGPYFRTCLCRV